MAGEMLPSIFIFGKVFKKIGGKPDNWHLFYNNGKIKFV